MAQGTHISRNIFHDNDQDVFVEVDHGPFLFDNNLLLSSVSLNDNSQGGAYAHNLFFGSIDMRHYDSRQTPFLKAHSAAVAGYHDNPRGDDRFYNNLFVQHADLSVYDNTPLPMTMDGNVFLDGAKPSGHEKGALNLPNFDPEIKLQAKPGGLYLYIRFDRAWIEAQQRKLVTGALLGKASIPDLPYEQPDGTPIRIDTDYLGKTRSESNPTPGPFERPGQGLLDIKVW
jgi:alpha-N-arabinofuranosidase